jgi:hypothetical protein
VIIDICLSNAWEHARDSKDVDDLCKWIAVWFGTRLLASFEKPIDGVKTAWEQNVSYPAHKAALYVWETVWDLATV